MSVKVYKWTIAALLCIVLYLAWSCGRLNDQLLDAHFIEAQIANTQEMIDKPVNLLSPQAVAWQLHFLTGYHDYHISGLDGSQIKWIVERDYRQTLTNVLAYLRKQTGKDLGDDPKAWIKYYSP